MSDISSPSPAKAQVDSRYYSDGLDWEKSRQRFLQARLGMWRMGTFMFALTTAAALGAILLMIPLQHTETVVLEVDKQTGYLQVMRPLVDDGKNLTENEAVTTSNIVQFIKARETYDPKGLRDNFDKASLLSTGRATQDLVNLYSGANPQNPVKLLGADTTISVQIKSVSFLNERTASVRFDTTTSAPTGSKIDSWVANVRWKYTQAPIRMDWRFDNPLGFQVFEYRKDQEAITPTKGPAQ